MTAKDKVAKTVTTITEKVTDKLLGTYHLCKAGKRITGYILIRLINTGKSRCAGHLKGRCDLHICICYAGGSQGVLIHLLGTPVNVLGGYIQSGAVVQYCDIHAGDGLMAYLFVVYQAFEILPLVFVGDGYLALSTDGIVLCIREGMVHLFPAFCVLYP